jgi:hypothetical protein
VDLSKNFKEVEGSSTTYLYPYPGLHVYAVVLDLFKIYPSAGILLPPKSFANVFPSIVNIPLLATGLAYLLATTKGSEVTKRPFISSEG